MHVTSLSLRDYRNYECLDLDFSKNINILYGDNAQGKTNILEAIYVASTTKSHKMARDKELIRFGCEEAHIRLNVSKHDIDSKIDMHLRKGKSKVVSIDGMSIKRSSELFGLINIIFFSPEDLSIIKNGPSERRRFMDMEMCQLSRIYYSDLSEYNKVLQQRNNLLKDINYNNSLLDTLDVWDMQLLKFGSRIIRERRNFVAMLNEIIIDIHRDITGNKEEIILSYDSSTDEERFEKDLLDKRNTDLKSGMTNVGPHRDDIGIYINDVDVRTYGSQGQQRTAALSLKLAEIELVKKITEDNPVLLLDDVMSELDSKRRDALLYEIKNIQTIITCTGYDDFIKERITMDKIYRVDKGTVV